MALSRGPERLAPGSLVLWAALCLTAASLAAACSFAVDTDVTPGAAPCDSDRDCNRGERCAEGFCTDEGEVPDPDAGDAANVDTDAPDDTSDSDAAPEDADVSDEPDVTPDAADGLDDVDADADADASEDADAAPDDADAGAPDDADAAPDDADAPDADAPYSDGGDDADAADAEPDVPPEIVVHDRVIVDLTLPVDLEDAVIGADGLGVASEYGAANVGAFTWTPTPATVEFQAGAADGTNLWPAFALYPDDPDLAYRFGALRRVTVDVRQELTRQAEPQLCGLALGFGGDASGQVNASALGGDLVLGQRDWTLSRHESKAPRDQVWIGYQAAANFNTEQLVVDLPVNEYDLFMGDAMAARTWTPQTTPSFQLQSNLGNENMWRVGDYMDYTLELVFDHEAGEIAITVTVNGSSRNTANWGSSGTVDWRYLDDLDLTGSGLDAAGLLDEVVTIGFYANGSSPGRCRYRRVVVESFQ